MFIVSALSNMGHKIKRLAIQKLSHLASGACWCTVMLEGVKVKLSLTFNVYSVHALH